MRAYHKLLCTPGARWDGLGPDHYDKQRIRTRQVSHHVRKLGDLGYRVTSSLSTPRPGRPPPAGSAQNFERPATGKEIDGSAGLGGAVTSLLRSLRRFD